MCAGSYFYLGLSDGLPESFRNYYVAIIIWHILSEM